MPSLRCIGFLLLAGSLATPVAHGQALSLSQAVQRSLTTNAALRAANQTIIATERRADLTGLAPAWTVGADIENAGGTGPYAGLQGTETTVRLSRVLELGGKRARRIDAADGKSGSVGQTEARRGAGRDGHVNESRHDPEKHRSFKIHRRHRELA